MKGPVRLFVICEILGYHVIAAFHKTYLCAIQGNLITITGINNRTLFHTDDGTNFHTTGTGAAHKCHNITIHKGTSGTIVGATGCAEELKVDGVGRIVFFSTIFPTYHESRLYIWPYRWLYHCLSYTGLCESPLVWIHQFSWLFQMGWHTQIVMPMY